MAQLFIASQYLLLSMMELKSRDEWMISLGLKQESFKRVITSTLKTIDIVASSHKNKMYKLISYSLPSKAFNSTRHQLLKEISKYRDIPSISSTLKDCTLDEQTQEFIMVQKISKSEKVLSRYLSNYKEESFQFWKKIAIKIAAEITERHQAGVLQRNISLQTISINKEGVSFEPPLPGWIQKQQFSLFPSLGTTSQDLYLAPQLKQTSGFSTQTDVYALGVVFVSMLSNSFISQNDTILESPKRIQWLTELIQDPNIKQVVTGMLSDCSQLRPTMSEVFETLKGGKYKLRKEKQEKSTLLLKLDLFRNQDSSDNCKFLSPPTRPFIEHWSEKSERHLLELHSSEQGDILLTLEMYLPQLTLHYLFRHPRLMTYLKHGRASVTLSNEGCIQFSTPSYCQYIIGIEANQKQIDSYLNQEEEWNVQTYSHTFRTVKKEESNLNDVLSKDQLCFSPLKHHLTPEIWLQIGDQLFGNCLIGCQYEFVITVYQKIIQNHPEKYEQIDELGVPLADLQDFPQEINIFEWYESNKAQKVFKGTPYDALSLCYYVSRLYEEGVGWYSKMVIKYPEDYRLSFGFANLQYNRGNHNEALKQYKRSIELNPKCYKAYEQIASIYDDYNVMNPVQGRKWAKEAYKLMPQRIMTNLLRCSYQKDGQKIQQILQKLIQEHPDNNHIKILYVQSCFSSNQQNQEIGINILKGCIKQKPFHGRFNFSLARLMQKSQKYEAEEIAILYNKVIKLEPRRAFTSYSNLSNLNCYSIEEKFNLCYKSIELNPFFIIGYLNLSILHEYTESYDKALEILLKAQEISPECPILYHLIGKLYHDHMDHIPNHIIQARRYYQKHINKCFQQSIQSHYRLGLLHKDLKSYSDCIYYFKKVLEFDPQRYIVHRIIGQCQYRLEHYEQAVQFYVKDYQLTHDQSLKTIIKLLYKQLGQQEEAAKWQ